MAIRQLKSTRRARGAAISAFLVLSLASAGVAPAASFADAVHAAKPIIELRLRSETVNQFLTNEIDLQLEARRERFKGTLKYATYDAARFATDTRKIWAQLEFIW
jgi:hypothetical protein